MTATLVTVIYVAMRADADYGRPRSALICSFPPHLPRCRYVPHVVRCVPVPSVVLIDRYRCPFVVGVPFVCAVGWIFRCGGVAIRLYPGR